MFIIPARVNTWQDKSRLIYPHILAFWDIFSSLAQVGEVQGRFPIDASGDAGTLTASLSDKQPLLLTFD